MLRRLIMGCCATVGLCGPANAEDFPIENPSVRVIGFGASDFVDTVKAYNLIPDDVVFIGPDEEGDVAVQFVLLEGWDSLSKVPGAKEACADLCEQDPNKRIHMITSTIKEGSDIQKIVYFDLNSVAKTDIILGSRGYTGCIVDQLVAESRRVAPGTVSCAPRMVGGSFTDRRRLQNRK